MGELSMLQREVSEWQARVFPDHTDPHVKACKVAEEAGEVCGAVVKLLEGSGRKTDEDVQQEIGDLVISLAGLADVLNYDFEGCVEARWEEVRLRTYDAAHVAPCPGCGGRQVQIGSLLHCDRCRDSRPAR